MNPIYDVVILGCGEAGIFAAYELASHRPELKVLALDQGRDIYHRSCPIVAGKVRECIHCPVCDTMCGFGGAGAFSDGKFNFTTQFGGWLTDFMEPRQVMELIDYVDSINVAHGATEQVFSTETAEAKALARRALGYDLHLLQARCKHLGTENNLRILQNIYEGLKDKLEFRFNTAVEHIARDGEGFRLTLEKGEEVSCRRLIAAPGRSGAEWFSNQCKALGLELLNNQVDIGVRVELPAKVFEHITDVVYESKLVYRTKQYGDQVRTFCMNPYGHVVAENVEGINTVNGHSYADPSLRSENTNFALLVSNRFTQPFNEPYRYGKHIASLSNMLAGGVLALIRFNGGIAYIIGKITAHIRSRRGAEFSIAGLVSLANLCTANNTIAIITVGPIAKEISDKFHIPPRRSASILDTFSCLVQGVIPYGAQMLMAAGIAQVSPLLIMEYLYYPLILGVCSILAIALAPGKTGKRRKS